MNNGVAATFDKWLSDDGIHLGEGVIQTLIQNGLKKLHLRLDVDERDTIRTVYEQLGKRNNAGGKRCYGCGGRHIREKCEVKKYWCSLCKSGNHNDSACTSQSRICKDCGIAENHCRRPCKENSWWKPERR